MSDSEPISSSGLDLNRFLNVKVQLVRENKSSRKIIVERITLDLSSSKICNTNKDSTDWYYFVGEDCVIDNHPIIVKNFPDYKKKINLRKTLSLVLKNEQIDKYYIDNKFVFNEHELMHSSTASQTVLQPIKKQKILLDNLEFDVECDSAVEFLLKFDEILDNEEDDFFYMNELLVFFEPFERDEINLYNITKEELVNQFLKKENIFKKKQAHLSKLQLKDCSSCSQFFDQMQLYFEKFFRPKTSSNSSIASRITNIIDRFPTNIRPKYYKTFTTCSSINQAKKKFMTYLHTVPNLNNPVYSPVIVDQSTQKVSKTIDARKLIESRIQKAQLPGQIELENLIARYTKKTSTNLSNEEMEDL
jgi:hypothetical protein